MEQNNHNIDMKNIKYSRVGDITYSDTLRSFIKAVTNKYPCSEYVVSNKHNDCAFHESSRGCLKSSKEIFDTIGTCNDGNGNTVKYKRIGLCLFLLRYVRYDKPRKYNLFQRSK